MGHILGMDIGGTKCAVILGLYGNKNIIILERSEFPTKNYKTPEKVIEQLCRSSETVLKKYGLAKSDLRGIGISCGGPLDSKNGIILGPPNLPGWEYVEIVKIIKQYFEVPCRLQNDANAGALAEWRFGVAQGREHVVFLTLGTGCGAGIIVNGQIYTGANDNAGECGHIRMADYGPSGYGKYGSMEGFCSGGGIVQLGNMVGLSYMQTGRDTRLASYIQSGKMSAKDIARMAREGDAASQEVFQIVGHQLGQGVSLIIDFLNPEMIVLGGLYMRCEDLLKREMEHVIKKESIRGSIAACEVVPAALGEQIGDYAALATALN